MKTKSAKPVGIPSVNFWECWVTFGRWRLSQGSSRHRCFDQSLLSKTPRFQARTNARLQQNFQIHIQYTCGLCYTVCVWLVNRLHVHSSLGCAQFHSLFGRPYKGRVANFGQDMYGIAQKKTKYKDQWTRGAWIGKATADQDMIIIETDKILKSRAVRATGGCFGTKVIY